MLWSGHSGENSGPNIQLWMSSAHRWQRYHTGEQMKGHRWRWRLGWAASGEASEHRAARKQAASQEPGPDRGGVSKEGGGNRGSAVSQNRG